MVSIIICSRTKTISSTLSENIKATINCKYEMVIINNSKSKYSIFEAYNLGIKNSKGDFWCFIHDDILFHTKGWGNKIKEIFKSNNQIGLLGVAGSKVKTKMPSAWWHCSDHNKVMHLRQHLDDKKVEDWHIGWKQASLEEVVVIDGFFMVGKPDKNIYFNENLTGFHNYDLNLSLAYKINNFKVVVTDSILIEHFSLGTLNISWYRSTIMFDSYYGKILSIQVKDTLSKEDFKKLEFKNGKLFCEKLLLHKLKKEAIYYWLKLIWLKPISKFHYKFLNIIFK